MGLMDLYITRSEFYPPTVMQSLTRVIPSPRKGTKNKIIQQNLSVHAKVQNWQKISKNNTYDVM